MFKPALCALFAIVAFGACLGVLRARADDAPAAPGAERVFELRKYYANPGKLDALNTRFREHTNKIFEKHGMTIIGFWTPADGKDVLIYILAYPSSDAAKKSWKEFGDDPDWKAARAESEKDGALVNHVESTYMKPTDYSPIK